MATNTVRPRGSFWPTPLQRELLEVTLAEPRNALEAWGSARARIHIETLEPGTFELLPLVYRRLADAGVDDPLLPKLKGIARKSVLLHALMLERTKSSARVLADHGVRALFVEGPALAISYYPQPGLRYTANVDVLVDAADLDTAVRALGAAGWGERPGTGDRFGGRRHLLDDDGHVCVVRPSVTVDFVDRFDPSAALEPLWERATPLPEDPVLLVPAPADALLAVCAAGARTRPEPSLQWIVDSAAVLRDGTVDWPRLESLAAARGQAQRLAAALSYLSTLAVPSPPRVVIERLSSVRPTLRERLAYRIAGAPDSRLGSLPSLATEHLAATVGHSTLHTLLTFPRHLVRRWELSHGRQLPGAVWRRAVRAARRSTDAAA